MAAINVTLAKKGLMLKTGTVVDATLIAAPRLTKNKVGDKRPANPSRVTWEGADSKMKCNTCQPSKVSRCKTPHPNAIASSSQKNA